MICGKATALGEDDATVVMRCGNIGYMDEHNLVLTSDIIIEVLDGYVIY